MIKDSPEVLSKGRTWQTKGTREVIRESRKERGKKGRRYKG